MLNESLSNNAQGQDGSMGEHRAGDAHHVPDPEMQSEQRLGGGGGGGRCTKGARQMYQFSKTFQRLPIALLPPPVLEQQSISLIELAASMC